ncbi:MAG: hypothetical protein LBR80_03145 [Deltaproteobacteria bacterium]|jgi:hypothetical protein|nr:hypothetical protein [Deltaproteobacteria bacterium]
MISVISRETDKGAGAQGFAGNDYRELFAVLPQNGRDIPGQRYRSPVGVQHERKPGHEAYVFQLTDEIIHRVIGNFRLETIAIAREV